MWRETVLTLVLLGVLAACNSTMGAPGHAGDGDSRHGTDATKVATVQLIVRFRTGTKAIDAGLLSRLSAAVGVPIAYLRPLSGDAHLLSVSIAPDAVPEIVRRLQHRPEVLDVQADLPVQPAS